MCSYAGSLRLGLTLSHSLCQTRMRFASFKTRREPPLLQIRGKPGRQTSKGFPDDPNLISGTRFPFRASSAQEVMFLDFVVDAARRYAEQASCLGLVSSAAQKSGGENKPLQFTESPAQIPSLFV